MGSPTGSRVVRSGGREGGRRVAPGADRPPGAGHQALALGLGHHHRRCGLLGHLHLEAPSGRPRAAATGSGCRPDGPGPRLTRASPTTTASRLPTTSSADSHMVDRADGPGRRPAAAAAARGPGAVGAAGPRGLGTGGGAGRQRGGRRRSAGPSGHFPGRGVLGRSRALGGAGASVASGRRSMTRRRAASARRLRPISSSEGRRAPRATRRNWGSAPQTQGSPGGHWQLSVDHAGEEGLDQPVLARVVGDHHAPPSRPQQVEGVLEGGGQLVELLVDGDPDGLEHPTGRMAAGAPGGGRDGLPHHVGQLPGGGQRAGGDDGPGDAAGEPPLAVVGEQSRPGRPRRTG